MLNTSIPSLYANVLISTQEHRMGWTFHVIPFKCLMLLLCVIVFIPNMPSNTWALLWEWIMDENSQQKICLVKISIFWFMEAFSWLGKICIYTCVHTFKPLHTCASRFEEQLRRSDSGEKRKGKKRQTDEDLLSWVSCGTTLYYEPLREKHTLTLGNYPGCHSSY